MNQLTTALLIAALVVGICYLGIFLFPDSPINPFRPQVLALVPTLTASPTGTATPPPTWTPTPIGSPSTPRPTFTPEPTETPHPTRTPTVIPTATIDPRIPTRSTFKYTNTQPVLRADPYGAACGNWGGVGGQVLDIDGSPLKGVSVVGWGGPIGEQNKLVFTSGSEKRINKFYNGEAGYELYIGAPGDFDFFVAVYEGGRTVSPIVKIRMVNDCSRDLAWINFQRNH